MHNVHCTYPQIILALWMSFGTRLQGDLSVVALVILIRLASPLDIPRSTLAMMRWL